MMSPCAGAAWTTSPMVPRGAPPPRDAPSTRVGAFIAPLTTGFLIQTRPYEDYTHTENICTPPTAFQSLAHAIRAASSPREIVM